MTGARFSIGQALAAGFRLSIRHPLPVLVWGLMLAAVSGAAFALVVPMMAALPLGEAGTVESPEAFVQSMTSLQLAINGLNLIQMVVSLMIWTAAMRATLKIGQKDRSLFLRFGMDELRVGVVMVAVFFGLYFIMLILALIGVGFGFALYAVGEAALVIGVFVMVLMLMAGLLVVWSRVSLLAPASMILGQFAFVEGWQMGRGQTGRLVGLNLLIYLIYMAAYVVVGIIVGAILIGGFFLSGCVWPKDPQNLGVVMSALKPMTVWIWMAFVPLILFAGWAISFVAGALTSAARQLADGAPVVEPHVDERLEPLDDAR